MKVVNIKNYASLRNNGTEKKGDTVDYPDRIAKQLERKGLVRKGYKTKEDKNAIKFHLEHDAGPMFFVMQGKKKVDRLHKKDAKKLVKKLNGS